MIRIFLLAATVAFIVGVGFVVDTRSKMDAPAPAVHVSTVTNIHSPGRVEGATPEVELRPERPGRVDRILVEQGDIVEKGDILIILDDREHKLEVLLAEVEHSMAESQLQRLINGSRKEERAEAEAIYRAKRSELERALLTWKRTSRLRAEDAVSQQEADNQRTIAESLTAEVEAAKARSNLLSAPAREDEVRIAKVRIEAAKARWDLAKVELDRTRVYAPGRAQVLQINVEPGELAGPRSVEPALALADTSRFRVRAFVEELDAPRVFVGQTAVVTVDGLPGKIFHGQVTRLSPRMGRKAMLTEQPDERFDTKTREVWIDLEQGESLVVGLRVDVVIETEKETANSDSL